jgi:hypothetical protein
LPPPRILVYVTRTGEVYHRGDGWCFHLKRKDRFLGIPMDLEEAERQGYPPCWDCQP